MKTKYFAQTLKMVLCGLFLAYTVPNYAQDDTPNIVLIFVDDLGWTDLGCYGNTYHETPNIDKLYNEGMHFQQAYATPLCGPSRASLYSGQNVTTHGAWTNHGFVPRYNRMPSIPFNQPDCKKYLDSRLVTFPELLKQKGYKTAMFGKSHMVTPNLQTSFDTVVNRVTKGGKVDYFKYGAKSNKAIPEPQEGEYLSDYLTDRALEYLEENKDHRFFLMLADHLPHTPVQGKPELVQKYEKKKRGDSPHKSAAYAAMVETVDTNTGRIVQKIKELNLSKETLILFASDNGGLRTPTATTNVPLRNGKGFLYEGGIRVPLIAVWEGVIDKGRRCDEIVHTIDFYPTLIDVAQADKPNHALEGLSFLPLLVNPDVQLGRNTMFWHFPGYAMGKKVPAAMPQSVIRQGDYKLIENLEDQTLELYDLKKDIGEKHNLAETMPEKTDKLYHKLKKWQADTGAPMVSRKK